MPFFSFKISEEFETNQWEINIENFQDIEPEVKYYSKNSDLWKFLNKKKNKQFITLANEERKKLDAIGDKILFCLPPNIGMGDAVEYALSIKSFRIKLQGHFSVFAYLY